MRLSKFTILFKSTIAKQVFLMLSMPYRFVALSFCFIALMLATGCKTVESQHLIGEKLTDEELEFFGGYWMLDSSLFPAHPVGDSSLRIAMTDWDSDEEEFEVESFEITLTKHDGLIYAQLKSVDEDDPPSEEELEAMPWTILGAMTIYEDDMVVMYPASFDDFAQHIEDDEIEGEIPNEDTCLITADKDALDEFISDTPTSVLFDVEDVGIFKRISPTPEDEED